MTFFIFAFGDLWLSLINRPSDPSSFDASILKRKCKDVLIGQSIYPFIYLLIYYIFKCNCWFIQEKKINAYHQFLFCHTNSNRKVLSMSVYCLFWHSSTDRNSPLYSWINAPASLGWEANTPLPTSTHNLIRNNPPHYIFFLLPQQAKHLQWYHQIKRHLNFVFIIFI